MQMHDIPTADLLLATAGVLRRLLLVWGAIALVKAALFFAFDLSGAHAVVIAILFGALFFSAPLAVSALRSRRRIRLFSHPSRKILLFSFVWGAVAVAMFVGFLHLSQGMEATVLNYAIAMFAGGLFCVATASLPNGR